MVLIPFATQYKSPNFFPVSEMQPRRAVVLHRTEGTYRSAINWFLSPASEVSSHVVISELGESAQMVPLDEGACTNGLRWSGSEWLTPVNRHPVVPTWVDIIPGVNPNLYTTTIELSGNSDDLVSSKMFAALIHVLQFIADQQHIWYNPHHTLIGHCEINPVDKAFCPGPNVHFDDIARAANTRWFGTTLTKVAKQDCVVYQAPDVHATIALKWSKGVAFATDAITIGRGFQKFYHMAGGQGFIHDSDVLT